MAWQPDVNQLQLAAHDKPGFFLWKIWRNLIDQGGWTPMGSSDGVTFENNGDTAGPFDVLTVSNNGQTYGSGVANSFSRAVNAWWRIQMPGSTLEIAVRRNTSTFSPFQFVVAIDPQGFTDTGVANATTPPTGPSTEFLHGISGWSNYQTLFSSSGVDMRIHVMVNDAAVNGVYSFWAAATESGASARHGGFTFYAMNQISVGDPQPWVIQCRQGDGVWVPSQDFSDDLNTGPQGFFDYGGGGENFSQFPGLSYEASSGQAVPAFLAAAPDGDYRHFPIVHASGNTGQFKGINAVAKYKSANGRNYPDTFDLAGGNPRVVMGDLVLPWASGVVPL